MPRWVSSYLIYGACLAIGMPSLQSQTISPPKYRCLAPLLWSLDAGAAPKNLYEAFLAGPYDRVDLPTTDQTAYTLGWQASLNADHPLAIRLFRQAWQDNARGEALVAMAIHQLDAPAVCRLFAKEAAAACTSVVWRDLATAIAEGSISDHQTLDLWCGAHPDSALDLVREWLLKEALRAGEFTQTTHSSWLLSHIGADRDWMHLAIADQMQLLIPPKQLAARVSNPATLEVALRLSLRNEDFATSSDLLATAADQNLLSPAIYPQIIELAHRTGQTQLARAWLETWRRSPAYTTADRAQRQRDTHAWTLRLADDSDLDSLHTRITSIQATFDSGDTRAALFSLTRSLQSIIASADQSTALAQMITPVTDAAGWRPSWQSRATPFRILMPTDVPTTLVPELTVTLPDGTHTTVDAMRNGRPALVIFFNGVTCPACIVQLQAFSKIHSSITELGFEVIALSAQPQKTLRQELATTTASFPFRFASADEQLTAFLRAGMYDGYEDYPTHGVLALSADGKEIWKHRSYEPFRKLDVLLEELRIQTDN